MVPSTGNDGGVAVSATTSTAVDDGRVAVAAVGDNGRVSVATVATAVDDGGL